MKKQRTYAAIDLKSFYASVECQERGLDPLRCNLVVADEERTDKTICLAVTPALKSYGISGRPRLFEVKQAVRKINEERKRRIGYREFTGNSADQKELEENPYLKLDFYIAVPRMAYYIEYSSRIYEIYLKYIAPEDIHVYSIDEVFIDVTDYLNTYHMSAHELTVHMIRDVLSSTGITATAGIGTNLFLAKVAMDIVAKHMPADKDGVRIAELDEISFRKQLWTHTPITDFWRIGGGIARRLEVNHMETMGDVARCSLEDIEFLYQLFGVNAELLIDHAWGYEPCTIQDIKAYKPQSNSLGSGQVLTKPYSYEKALLVVKEMADQLALDLCDKNLVTKKINLYIGFDTESADQLHNEEQIVVDAFGRKMPKPAHATVSLRRYTSSGKELRHAVTQAYQKIVNRKFLVRRITLTAMDIRREEEVRSEYHTVQYSLFDDISHLEEMEKAYDEDSDKEKRVQEAILKLRHKYGQNSILKGMDLEEDATTIQRHKQIGGHKA